MLIFFDTEFTNLDISSKLISIGLISENGQECYAEMTDTYAEINRANLYTTYPHLITQIKSFRIKKVSNKPKSSDTTSLVEENKKLKFQLKVLGYTCIELRHALDREKNKSKYLTSRLERLKNK